MPSIIKKEHSLLVETKHETHGSVIWRVRSNVWSPPTDIYETDVSVVVKIEVAGAQDEDFEILVQGNLLSISGKRSDTSEHRAYHQMEIPFGKFSLGIELPAKIIVDDAIAEYKNGFLTIKLPKEKLDI